MFVATVYRRWNIFCAGDNMNTFLNENWKELVREFSPIIGEALSEIAKTVVTNIIEVVPYEESFPERV